MGNTPSAQHGSPSRPSTHVTSPPPSNPAPGPGPTNPSPSTSTNSRHPNLRLPMPSRPTHISPQSSNPTSPSGRGGSPRRRKSLELPDLNKLSFTPAAPVPVTATTTNHLAVGTPSGGSKRHSDSVVPASAPSGRKWQHVLGGRASPLAGANTLGAMSRLASASPSEPKSVPTKIPDPSTSPSKSTHETVNPYFPASPTRSKGSTAIPIPGKTEKDGIIPPPSTVPATPPSRDEGGRTDDGLVNVPVQWVGGGKVVYVTGNFADNWRGRIKLKRSTHDFNTILRLPPGQYRMKFIVDDSWRCSKQIPTATDDDGTLVNWIEVEPTKTEEELKAEWAMDSKPAAIKEDEDDSQWTNVIPAPLVAYQYIEELPLTMEPSDFDTFLRSIPYLSSVPQPPTLPRILDKVIVNAEPRRRGDDGLSSAGGTGSHTPAGLDDNSILAVPNHVVLNHLTASAIKNGTLGVGTTTRYRKKYITTMFFKPSSADMQSETQGHPDGFPR